MANKRIKDLATTASSAASDDFMALDGVTNGTRKMSAANPSVTTLTTSGVIAPGGSVHGANGTAANPSFAFNSDQNTGLYRIGADNIGVAVGGVKVLDVASTGLTVTGALGASSLTSPAATNLTLAGGAGNSSVILTPAGTGNVGIGTASPNVKLELGLGTISNVEPNQYLRVNAGTYNSAISANLDLLCWGNNFTNSLGWRLSSVNLAGVSTARDLTFNSLVDGGSGIVGAATERMRIASATGNVSIASSTAGSSGAGALVVSGGLATGAASYIGGALTVIGVAENISAQFGSSTSSQIYIRDNTINCASGNNGAETLRFNYVGYNNGTTQFRNSVFHDGKAAVVATFTGSDKSATFAGAVTVNADAFSFLDLPTGIFRNGSTGYISSDPNEGAIFSTNAYFNTNWTGTGSGAYIYLGKSGGASQQKIFFGRTSSGAPTTTITFDVSTGAATFTGAVEIGNTVNTVSPTSPNRTVTMVVNGVTLYLAAKTTND